MPTTTNIYLPVQFDQLVELVKTLPKKEKQQLMEVLEQEEPTAIPEWQKQEVRRRIKKYNKHPELLVDEKTALERIKQL